MPQKHHQTQQFTACKKRKPTCLLLKRRLRATHETSVTPSPSIWAGGSPPHPHTPSCCAAQPGSKWKKSPGCCCQPLRQGAFPAGIQAPLNPSAAGRGVSKQQEGGGVWWGGGGTCKHKGGRGRGVEVALGGWSDGAIMRGACAPLEEEGPDPVPK